jgi:hypothetical protein
MDMKRNFAYFKSDKSVESAVFMIRVLSLTLLPLREMDASASGNGNFVEHVRRLNATVRIVVVAGVVQAQSARKEGPLRKIACKHGKMKIIALRLLKNKYTSSGTTDTRNRLFNLTHLE